jgi:hypothetical protein
MFPDDSQGSQEMKHPPYHLRVNKAVDRFMLIEILDTLARELGSLQDYKYYGLGGPFLEDFRLMSEHFTDLPLVSVESSEHTHRRQKFHRCAKNITLRKESVQSFLLSGVMVEAERVLARLYRLETRSDSGVSITR